MYIHRSMRNRDAEIWGQPEGSINLHPALSGFFFFFSQMCLTQRAAREGFSCPCLSTGLLALDTRAMSGLHGKCFYHQVISPALQRNSWSKIMCSKVPRKKPTYCWLIRTSWLGSEPNCRVPSWPRFSSFTEHSLSTSVCDLASSWLSAMYKMSSYSIWNLWHITHVCCSLPTWYFHQYTWKCLALWLFFCSQTIKIPWNCFTLTHGIQTSLNLF